MKRKMGHYGLGVLLTVLLLMLLPGQVFAAEVGRFVLVAEAGGTCILGPEYISYTEGQTVKEALAASGHSFTGLEEGAVTAIDSVAGNFTRSDEDGGYDLQRPASEVTHYRFSEESNSTPSQGLQALMTAMADYREKPQDVQAAAKEAYEMACRQFVGVSSNSAWTLASELNKAVSDYEDSLQGPAYALTMTDGTNVYSQTHYPGVQLWAENAYGHRWEDDGDGMLDLPAGTYAFGIVQNGLRVEGTVTLSEKQTLTAVLPKQNWLTAFRLSGTYGGEDNEETRFTDGEFTLPAWENRCMTVPVSDTFSGAVYTYAEYDTALLDKVPSLTAIYTLAHTGETMEKTLAFQSKTSGAYQVLKEGKLGNAVIYRLSVQAEQGYTYSQDYTVSFSRLPTLTGLTLKDQNGTDLAATTVFAPETTAYTYKVLDTVTAVTVSAQTLETGYTVTVNGEPLTENGTIAISGDTSISVTVSDGSNDRTYLLTVQPGQGKNLSFLSDQAVSIQVVNSNGVVMPYKAFKELNGQNNYKYTLVPGEEYRYIATYNTYYHMSDTFRLEEVANSKIQVDFSEMEDWLTELAFGTKQPAAYKGSLAMTEVFSPEQHSYQLTYGDTEHLAYVWANTAETGVTITANYTQIFNAPIYHGKELSLPLTFGSTQGQVLKRFLMDENPVENNLTIQLSKEVDGVRWYQDYTVEFHRSLTLAGMTAQKDGAQAVLTQSNGATGFAPEILDYSVTVSMATKALMVNFQCYTDNCCYGEETVGYRVVVDGEDVTEAGTATISLDGTMQPQTVTVAVSNPKAPAGTREYHIQILKSPPVTADFTLAPSDAVLTLQETLSGERLWPETEGTFQLCEGYSYAYTLTKNGYVGMSGTLKVTRDENGALVVENGKDRYTVTEDGTGGTVSILWSLQAAAANGNIQTNLSSSWPNFRGNNSNNAVTSAAIPTTAEGGTLYWANQIGSGFDADAVGSPILVDGDLITYAGDTIYRVDPVNGEIRKTGTMDHKSSFAITPPTYAEGMVFVALSDGTVQAFNASTLESLWIYKDPLGGQPNSPLTVKNGYLYTGFWNSETGNANFVCLSITDEDPTQTGERKCASWSYTRKGGFYWAGAYASDRFLLVGTDDGATGYTSQTSSLLLLDPKTGAVLDRWDGLNGDIRSTVAYDAATDAYYFTSKGGSFYSVQVTDDRKITNKWSISLVNGTGGVPMSTCTPVVYNGRAYVGVSGQGQFTPYSGHNLTVIDLGSRAIAYSVPTQGYPQTSGLLTTAYGDWVYVYFFDNMTPGKLRILRDQPGQTAAKELTTEGSRETAYALFTPTGEQAEYAICSPIVDEYGTIYFKNDSAHLMAFGSTIKELQVTSQPDKTRYQQGETFDAAGLVVTAVYANGKTRDVTKYLTWPEEPLTAEDSSFTLSFPCVMYHNAEDGTAMKAGVTTVTPTVTLNLTVESQTLGDVNGDGTIDLADAQCILDGEAGLTELPQASVADVSGDGSVDSNDAVLIAQYVGGLLDQFPAAAPETEAEE